MLMHVDITDMTYTSPRKSYF